MSSMKQRNVEDRAGDLHVQSIELESYRSTNNTNTHSHSVNNIRFQPPDKDNIDGNGNGNSGITSDAANSLYSINRESTHNIDIDSTSVATAAATVEAGGEEDNFQYDKGHFKVVVGSMIGLMPAWGIMSSIGVIQSYVSEHQLSNIQASHTSWIFSIYSFFTMGGCLVIGPFFDLYGAKTLLLVGNLLLCGGLIGTSFCYSLYQFILSFGVLVGIGSAFIVTPLVSAVTHYYHEKLGLMSGISQLGGSIGGVLIPLFLRKLYVQVGWGWAIRVLALYSFVCTTIAILTVTDRTKELNKDKPKAKLLHLIKQNFDVEPLKEKTFVVLIAAMVCTEFSLLLVLTYLPSYAIAEGISESSSFLMIVIFGVSGLFGHIIPSLISDYYGRFNVMLINTFLMTVVTFTLWLPARYYPQKLLGLYFFSVIYGFLVSAAYSLIPALIGQLSRVEDMGKRFGTVYGFVACFNLASLPIGGKLLGDGDMDGYDKLIILSGSVCGMACISIFVLKFMLNPKLFKSV